MELSIPGKSVFIQGSNGSPAMKFPDLFLTFSWQSPNFYWLFAAWKYDILTVTQMQKKYCSDDLAKKVWFIILCAVLSKSWHNLQNVKYYGNTFPNFLAFLVGNCETEQQRDIDSQNLKWGLHIDINSIFTFWRISKFPDTYQNLLTFSWLFKFLTFPDFFLTCGNPVMSKRGLGGFRLYSVP